METLRSLCSTFPPVFAKNETMKSLCRNHKNAKKKWRWSSTRQRERVCVEIICVNGKTISFSCHQRCCRCRRHRHSFFCVVTLRALGGGVTLHGQILIHLLVNHFTRNLRVLYFLEGQTMPTTHPPSLTPPNATYFCVRFGKKGENICKFP